MTINEALNLPLAFMAGVVLGGIFFGGMWWTVSLGLSSGRAPLWFICSVLVRMSIALTGFYYVARGDGERLLTCVFGFVLARVVVTRLARPRPGGRSWFTKEIPHAPQSR